MSRRLRLALGLSVLCAACAATPEAPQPRAHTRVGEIGARATALARAGDHAAAAREYEEALRIARSLDDADAIAAHAINLSIVYQWLGRPAAARAALSVILDDGHRPFPELRRVQAELRQAILDLAGHDAERAVAMAQRARERCRRIDCPLEAAALNVQAHAALEAGRAQEAEQLAQDAESSARGRADRAEAANALRTIGRARHALGDPQGAIVALEHALELDRALADPRKIHADLVELERASGTKGDLDAARGYAERARAISRSTGEAPDIEGAEVQLRVR